MFHSWLKSHNTSGYTFGNRLFPKASEREIWGKLDFGNAVEEAEGFLGYEWPLIRASQYMAFEKEGNRVAQEAPHFSRRNALAALVEGELCEYKGRFIPDIADGIFAICEETFWGVSAHHPEYAHRKDIIPRGDFHHIDLFAAETAAMLAVIYHIFYDELNEYCKDIILRIEYELEKRIISHYLIHTEYWWMGYGGVRVNNWNPWIISNILTVFLITRPGKERLYEGIEKMMTEIQAIYSQIPEDGGCDEGPLYWGVSGGMLIEFCWQLYKVTEGKINFFEDKKLEKIALYEVGCYAGGGHFACFADGIPKFSMKIDAPLYLAGSLTGNKALKSFAGESLKKAETAAEPVLRRDYRLRRNLISRLLSADIKKEGSFEDGSEYIYENSQLAFMRNNGWFLAAKGGHNNESHNHNDVGSFVVYKDGTPVIIDPGCGTYTKKHFSDERYTIWNMQTKWHSLPIINGAGQKEGKEFRASCFEAGNGRSAVEFAKAYTEASAVRKASREIILSGSGVKLSDSFSFMNEENKIEEGFIVCGEVKAEGNKAVIKGKYVIEAFCDAEVSVEYLDFEGDEKLIGGWNADGINRICFSFKTGREAEITFAVREIQ